jgi:hypothetical protein
MAFSTSNKHLPFWQSIHKLSITPRRVFGIFTTTLPTQGFSCPNNIQGILTQ